MTCHVEQTIPDIHVTVICYMPGSAIQCSEDTCSDPTKGAEALVEGMIPVRILLR